jgi:acetyl-CoA carboxylase biotin carboxyl carrier protein
MRELEESKLSKLIVKRKDFELHLEKESSQTTPPRRVIAETVQEAAFQSDMSMHGERGAEGGRRVEPKGTYITSPMVGTFYASPAPDEPPFIKVGDMVRENTVVCIIEAMKVMNEVKAGVAGKVVEVLHDSGSLVEFGSRLFRIA